MTVSRKRKRILGRPRYVAALTAGAVLVAGLEAGELCRVGLEVYQHRWLGLRASEAAAVALLALRLGAYAAGLCGLWQARAWARLVAMGYLGAELAAFLLFGAGDWRGFFGLHMFLVPYATFCLMYLQRDAAEYR